MRLRTETIRDDYTNKIIERWANLEYKPSEEEKAEFVINYFKECGFEWCSSGVDPEENGGLEWWILGGEGTDADEIADIKDVYRAAKKEWSEKKDV